MNPFRPLSALATALLGAALAAPAVATETVYWATYAETASGTPAPAMVGAPDLAWQTSNARAAKFDLRIDYATLAATIGIPPAELARYDVIAWEGNGGSPGYSGGWESVRLTFDDLHTAVVARYDEVGNTSDNPAVQFRTGSISGRAYDALFGTHGAEPVMSWLLADLPDAIDVHSPSLNITYELGGLTDGRGEGSPDLDAIGVLGTTGTVPEPATLAMVGLALTTLTTLRGASRRRRGHLAC